MAFAQTGQEPDYRCLQLTSLRGGPEPGTPQIGDLARRLPEALAACTEGARLRPREGRMEAALARVLAMSGNTDAALDAARRAVAIDDDPEALLLLGVHAARRGDYSTARVNFENASRRTRDGIGYFNLGVLWSMGLGVPRDAQDAANFFRDAALTHDPMAMAVMGQLTQRGIGVAPDPAAAESWWEKAAQAWNAEGVANPLRMPLPAFVFESDAVVEAVRERAERNVIWAQSALGQWYDAGQWVPQDHATAAFWYRKAATAGDMGSAYRLYDFYHEGLGVEVDEDEARRWAEMPRARYCESLTQGAPEANECDRLASAPYDSAAAAPAVPNDCLEKFAERAIAACGRAVAAHPGVPRFSAQLARALAHAQRFARAEEAARTAARAGSTQAMILLGTMRQRGLGEPPDGKAALDWYRKAAVAGDARGDALMLEALRQGIGHAAGSPEAVALQEEADARRSRSPISLHGEDDAILAEQGQARAQHNLALRLESSGDFAQAMQWYQRAAQQGWQASALNLGLLHEQGAGGRPNPGAAIEAYTPLADKGNAEARYRLARLHEGQGNADDALRLLRKGAEHRHFDSLLRLAQIHEQGLGVPADAVQAAGYYRQAAEVSGTRWLHSKLGILALTGTGMARDPGQARAWLERAAERGDHAAHNNLGQIHERGLGVRVDIRKARDHYLAALHGTALARGNLEQLYDRDAGVPTDPAQRIAWYRPGAEAGIIAAQWRLGKTLRGGKDDPPPEALRWLDAAARQGHTEARREAADAYLAVARRLLEQSKTDARPDHATRDARQAQEALLRAASNGRTEAFELMTLQQMVAWRAMRTQRPTPSPRPALPTGLSEQPDEDTMAGMQLHIGAMSEPKLVGFDAAYGNAYTIIPWSADDERHAKRAAKPAPQPQVSR